MIDLWYLNTKSINEEAVESLIKTLPREMINEIIRFRNHVDRRFKLFGKLIVRKYYKDSGLGFNWGKWTLESGGKPYYKGGKKFNISHSGEHIIVAFSDQEIGTDIERLTNFDLNSVLSYLHPLEAECIQNAPNSKETFYRVWTRKEAYLKAIGKGIIDGLNNENCLPDELINKKIWHLHSMSIISNYQIALCTQIPNCQINTRELLPHEFHL